VRRVCEYFSRCHGIFLRQAARDSAPFTALLGANGVACAMKLLFIRHGIAMERPEFEGDDMDRPLTEEGQRKAQKAFLGLARIYDDPELILHSPAVRARQTAALLAEQFSRSELKESMLLSPGAGYASLLQALAGLNEGLELIALVGHEPDFSEMISGLLQSARDGDERPGFLHLDLRKASCAEVELHGPGAGELRSLLAPKILRKLASV
jgi:phosphohistidine phosphatase